MFDHARVRPVRVCGDRIADSLWVVAEKGWKEQEGTGKEESRRSKGEKAEPGPSTPISSIESSVAGGPDKHKS